MARTASKSLFTPDLLLPAVGDSFRKLNPKELIRNPVMFTTACVAALLTILLVVGHDTLGVGFKLQLVIWLWLTVLFGTFAEAIAEGRGKAQAASLRATKTLMKRAGEHEIRTQMAEESVHFGKMLLAPEAREAFSAFLEKRKPDFRQFD